LVPENGQQQALGGDEFAGLPRIEDGARLFLRDGVSFGVIMGKEREPSKS
jgi:hypothetical protein